MRHIPTAAIYYLIYFTLISNAFAQMHVIKGDLEAKYYSWTGRLSDTQITHFIVSLDGDRWLIKSEYTTNWFWLVGGDATNVYSVLIDPKAPSLSPAPATIFSGDFPWAAYDQVTIPWLTFCSSHYLVHSSDKNSIPSIWSQARIDPMAHICSSEVTQFAAPPYLAKDIKWITSLNQIAIASTNQHLRVEDATADDMARRSFDFKANLNSGVTLGHYGVLISTNMDGLLFPIKCELDAYNYASPSQIAAERKVVDGMSRTNSIINKVLTETNLVAVYTVTVTEISLESNHAIMPQLERSLSVADYRLSSRASGIEYVFYLSKQWKPQIDAELLKLLEDKKKHPPVNLAIEKPISPQLLNAVRAIIVSLFFAPLIIWGVKKYKQTNKKKGML